MALALMGGASALAWFLGARGGSRRQREILQISDWTIQASPDAVSVCDRNYVYRRVNRAYLQFHATTEPQIVGHTVAELLGDDVFRNVVKPKFDHCLTGGVVSYDHWFEFKGAGRRYASVTYAPLRSDHDTVEGVIVFVRDITDQHVAQEALREREHRLRHMVDNLPAGAVYVQGSEILINPAAEKITGYVKEELRTLDDWFHALYGTEASTVRAMSERGSEDEKNLAWITRKDGEKRLVEHISYEDEDSKVWLLNDVTEQMRAREDLERTRALLLAAVEQSPAGIVIADAPTGEILLVNHAQLGDGSGNTSAKSYEPFQMFPSGWKAMRRGSGELTHGELPLARAIREGAVLRNIDLIVERNQERRWVLCNAAPVRGSSGEVVAGVVLFSDFTEVVRTHEALASSEARLRLALRSARMGIWDWSEERGRLSWSEDAARLFGFSNDRQSGTIDDVLEAAHPEDRATIRGTMASALRSGVEVDLEHRVCLPNGDTRWVSGRGQIHRDEQGRAVRVAGTIWDITEAKRAKAENELLEAQLRQAQKLEALGTLAGGIAHDFNNILMAIIGFAELVRAETEPGSEMRDHIEQVLRASNRAGRLVRQILSFTRRKEHSGTDPIQPHPVVEEAAQLLRATLPSTIELQLTTEPFDGCIIGDGGQLQQILLNLGANAAHAMRQGGGTLTLMLTEVVLGEEAAATPTVVGALSPGRWAKMTMEDTGHGMDAATLERIFDPFFTTKAPGEGTGLGLSVVHGIVHRAQGALRVNSEPGRGTKFEVYLRIHDLAELAGEVDVATTPPGVGRVLFVDDEEALVSLGRMQLERLGYRVTAQTSSEAALEQFLARPEDFDIVVTDQTMPKKSGLELAREVRKVRPDLPVVLTTGFGQDMTTEDLEGDDVDILVLKPYSMQELARAIREGLDVRRTPS